MVKRVVPAFTVRPIDRQAYIIRLQFDVDNAMARFDFDCVAIGEAYFDQLSELRLEKFAEYDARVKFPLSDRGPLYVEPLQFNIRLTAQPIN